MRELESSLEGYFRHRVRLAGGYSVKLAPMEAGVPDRLAIFPGNRLFLVELKGMDTRLSMVQRVWHQRMYETWEVPVYTLRGRGEVVHWIRSVVSAYDPPLEKPGRKPKDQAV